MSEHDQQQYQLMRNYLQFFENEQLKLNKLIDILDALIESLQTTNRDWKESFRSEWWTLEQVYAVALDRTEAYLSPESQQLVEETIINMKLLLDEIQK